MSLGKALLERLGLHQSAPDADAFDMRLMRIGRREARVAALGMLFKHQPQHQAA